MLIALSAVAVDLTLMMRADKLVNMQTYIMFIQPFSNVILHLLMRGTDREGGGRKEGSREEKRAIHKRLTRRWGWLGAREDDWLAFHHLPLLSVVI